jgi:hypothetical protein
MILPKVSQNILGHDIAKVFQNILGHDMNHQTPVHIAQWHKPLVIIALHNMQCAHYKLQNPKSWIIATCKDKITITPQQVGIWESKLYLNFWSLIKLWQWSIDNCWPTKISTCKLHDTMMHHSPSMHSGTLHISVCDSWILPSLMWWFEWSTKWSNPSCCLS